MDEVDRLIALNKQHSNLFIAQQPERYEYREGHPTEISWLKCMDGRVHGSVMTSTPLGIIQPYRNLGGMFDFDWQIFGNCILEWVKYSFSRDRNCILICSYHFARGSEHRGCAGFGYNTEAAKESSARLCQIFNSRHTNKASNGKMARAIHVGVDTDYDSLILHGDDGTTLDLYEKLKRGSVDDESLFARLEKMYPQNMSNQMRKDLVRLLRGNVTHIKEITESGRIPEEVDHKEDVLYLGLGSDWLHEINKALIISPFDPNLNVPIRTAGNIIDKNKDVPKDKPIVLVTSARYREEIEKPYAEGYARYLRKLAVKAIAKELPDLHNRLYTLAVTVDTNTRRFDMIETAKAA